MTDMIKIIILGMIKTMIIEIGEMKKEIIMMKTAINLMIANM